MLRNTSVAVIGGDQRQIVLADLLSADGLPVYTIGFERKEEKNHNLLPSDTIEDVIHIVKCVVLPLPFSADGIFVNAPFSKKPILLEDIWRAVPKNTLIMGGLFTDTVYKAASKYGFQAVDYYQQEELAVLNTIPTAEGAIQIALEEMPITVHNCNSLVIGFGRVGKTLSKMLGGLGARVTGTAREYADLAWFETLGYKSAPLGRLPAIMNKFDVIFNTVPALILDEPLLSKCKKNVLIIDLASKPGGVDQGAARQHEIKAIHALSLPGKVAPYTAGRFMKQTIQHILEEKELI